jgi:hypothetical protein
MHTILIRDPGRLLCGIHGGELTPENMGRSVKKTWWNGLRYIKKNGIYHFTNIRCVCFFVQLWPYWRHARKFCCDFWEEITAPGLQENSLLFLGMIPVKLGIDSQQKHDYDSLYSYLGLDSELGKIF